MGEELVSILIPVYNRVNLVGESIESAINQTYKNIEIIIVDNCSTDGTWQVLKNYATKDSRIRIFQNSENVGPVLNWKRCIEEAKGEYAKILFSDDLISENFVAETIGLLDEDTAFVLSDIKVLRQDTIGKSSYFSKRNEYDVSDYLYDVLIYGTYGFSVSPACAMFRTEDLKKSLMFDIPNEFNLDFKNFGAGNDLLIFLLTAMRYKKVRVAVNAIAFYRAHNDSFTINNDLSLYYDYAKYYFITNYSSQYLKDYKHSLIFREKRQNKSNAVIDLISIKQSSVSYISFIVVKGYKALQRKLF